LEEGNGTFYINYNWKVLRAIINMQAAVDYQPTLRGKGVLRADKKIGECAWGIFWWCVWRRKVRVCLL
jgi:hypothetical protein